MPGHELVLASGSPRRKELLERRGYRLLVDPADIDEIVADGEDPLAATARLAMEKALVVAARHPGAVILAADTSVVLDRRMLGKPRDTEDAVGMLRELSGRNHQVITAWAVVDARQAVGGFTASWVRMRDLTVAEIRAYVAGGEPMDKAGAYAVQGQARRFVVRVLGSVDNVIGLPVDQVAAVLASFGVVPQTAHAAGVSAVADEDERGGEGADANADDRASRGGRGDSSEGSRP